MNHYPKGRVTQNWKGSLLIVKMLPKHVIFLNLIKFFWHNCDALILKLRCNAAIL